MSMLDLPLLLAGNFNTILNSSEHEGVFYHYTSKASYFQNSIHEYHLFHFKGQILLDVTDKGVWLGFELV